MHTPPTRVNKENWQFLSDHLKNTGRLAEGFAGGSDAQELGAVAGLLHDRGKYTAEFQQRLTGDYGRVDHSAAGPRSQWNMSFGSC